MNQCLQGKVALVLGASAEGGIGWAIAERYAAEGANVVVGARSVKPLQRLAERIGGVAVQCDAGSDLDIRHLREVAMNSYGKIDIAVNSAATPVLGLIADATPETLIQGMQVNYLGMVYFVRDMAAVMADGGAIVLVSSMTATHPTIPHFSYGCGKAAMESLVRYAGMEYGPRNIRVNAMRVGTALSDMTRMIYESPGVGERFIHEIPMGRLGLPDEMAEAALWLATFPYITGSIVDVSGGNQLTRFPSAAELPGNGEGYNGSGPLHDRMHGNAV